MPGNILYVNNILIARAKYYAGILHALVRQEVVKTDTLTVEWSVIHILLRRCLRSNADEMSYCKDLIHFFQCNVSLAISDIAFHDVHVILLEIATCMQLD
jgi:hypothetical protein